MSNWYFLLYFLFFSYNIVCAFWTTSEHWAVFKKLSMVLKSLFTKWVGVHHYAHTVGSCSKSREKSIKGWYCEVWLWEPHPSIFSVPTWTKADNKEEVCLGLPGSVAAAVGWSSGTNIDSKRELSAARRKDCTLCRWHVHCLWCAPVLERLRRAGPSFSSLTVLPLSG